MNPTESGSIKGSSQPPTRLVQVGGPAIRESVISRVSVKGTLYYYTKDVQPLAYPFVFSREQTTEEQAFGPRTLKVGPEWSKLEVGWIKTCGGLLLISEEGRRPQRTLSPEQREELKKRVVEISLLPIQTINLHRLFPQTTQLGPRDMHDAPRMEEPTTQSEPELTPLLYLPPGESSGPFYPVNVHSIYLRCPSLAVGETVKVTAVVIPG